MLRDTDYRGIIRDPLYEDPLNFLAVRPIFVLDISRDVPIIQRIILITPVIGCSRADGYTVFELIRSEHQVIASGDWKSISIGAIIGARLLETPEVLLEETVR